MAENHDCIIQENALPLYPVFSNLLTITNNTYSLMKKLLLLILLVAANMFVWAAWDGKPKYELHTTAATKTITVRGGVEKLFRFSCGVACVKHKKGWFVIDKQGNKLFDLPQGYHPAGSDYDAETNVKFSNDRLLILKSEGYYNVNARIIDKRGATVKDLCKLAGAYPMIDGVARIVEKVGFREKVSYINSNGQKIAPNTPNSRIYSLWEGLRCYQDPQTKQWGFTDANCNIVIPAKFMDVGPFYNGLAQARNSDRLWGFINKQGAWAIQPQYTRAVGTFRGPYALIYDKSDRSYYMDQSGKLVWKNPDPRNTICSEFRKEGYAVWTMFNDSVANAYAPMVIVNSSFNIVGKINRRLYEVNTQGEVVASNAQWFQWQEPFSGSKVFDWHGNMLLDFEGLDIFSEGLCTSWLERRANQFYFNDKGEIIVKFEDTQF